MRSEAHEILERALSLPEADRLLVARTLLESIHQEHDDTVADAWRDEVLRQVAEVHRGDVATEPWSKVRAALCALFVAPDGALEGFEFSNQTRCWASLVERVDEPGRHLTLFHDRYPCGYLMPVNDHFGAYLSSFRGGGELFFEFSHAGIHALRPRDPSDVPSASIMLLHAFPEDYEPGQSESWDTIVSNPAIPPMNLLSDRVDEYEYLTRDSYGLARRQRVPGATDSAGSHVR
jgi:hypothetical protein